MASIVRSGLKSAKNIAKLSQVVKTAPVQAVRCMSTSGSVIELSSYLEKRISQKSAEYAAV